MADLFFINNNIDFASYADDATPLPTFVDRIFPKLYIFWNLMSLTY